MPHEVYVFGDSHWRVYFPFLNTGAPGVYHEEDGITTIDTTANELSGATMWGLAHEGSKQGARRRILSTLDDFGGVENVGLVFGEVDVRYHYSRYFRPDNSLNFPLMLELITRYRRFIDEDLIGSGRVRGKVLVYYGFAYPHRELTHIQPGITIGDPEWRAASMFNSMLEQLIANVLPWCSDRICPIVPGSKNVEQFVSDDTVHLRPELYHRFILPGMKRFLDG